MVVDVWVKTVRGSYSYPVFQFRAHKTRGAWGLFSVPPAWHSRFLFFCHSWRNFSTTSYTMIIFHVFGFLVMNYSGSAINASSSLNKTNLPFARGRPKSEKQTKCTQRCWWRWESWHHLSICHSQERYTENLPRWDCRRMYWFIRVFKFWVKYSSPYDMERSLYSKESTNRWRLTLNF